MKTNKLISLPPSKLLFTLVLYLLGISPAFSQGYVFLGDAGPLNSDCIRLTYDSLYSTGIAWSESKLNLEAYFRIEFDIYLGADDLGADGITFVMQADNRGYNAYGTFGEGMGYGRFNPIGGGTSIYPSIAVEFDTYQNRNQRDPEGDHIALLLNGSSGHYWNLPVHTEDNLQLEDNYLHNFQFSWDPELNEVVVLFDNQTIIRHSINLRTEVFSDRTNLIWGFTSSTGRKHNLQYFCLRRMAFHYDRRSENSTETAEH